MNPNVTIGIAAIAAIAAGLAAAGAHRWAKRRRWRYVPRYVSGTTIGLIAFSFPLFISLPINDAVLWLACLVLIFVVEGFATWLAHDADPDETGTKPAADAVTRWIDEELGK